MRLHVASHGGVGTTMLMRWLALHAVVNCPDDSDGLKHAWPDQDCCAPDVKHVYLYTRDPAAACVSLYRRNFAAWQAQKLRESVVPPARLTEVVTCPFDFLRHYQAWTSSVLQPVLLRHEDLWSAATQQYIADLLQLPLMQVVQTFPIQRARRWATPLHIQLLYATQRKGMDI